MDYEKRYKDALERARKLCDVADTFTSDDINTIFPELKESEDERIKREILELVSTAGNGNQFEEIKDWLKKQGEQPHVEPGQQELKPKFHEGEWVVLTAGELSTTLQIVKVDTNKKLYWFNDSSYLPIVDEECLRHWTIKDAKDGDVLASKNREDTLIFRNLDSNTSFSSYYNTSDKSELGWSNRCFIPATKEQRNLLFQKMKDAGYEWDAEKKELKKIGPKKLDPNKVIEWLENQACQGWIEDVEVEKFVDKFKKDFGL